MCNHRIHRSEALLIQHCTAWSQQHPLPRHSYRSSGSELSSTKTHSNVLPIDQQAEAQGVLTSGYYIHFVNKQSETQMSSYPSLTSMVSQAALWAPTPIYLLWSSSAIKYKHKVS